MKKQEMTAIIATGYGTSEVLKVARVEKPSPGPKEILIRVKAASAATAETMMLSGKPYIARLFVGLTKPKRPIPGTGFAGVIEAKGGEVHNFDIGEEVFGETSFSFSTNAEYVVVPADGIVLRKPDSLPFTEAACYCDGHLTSYNFLKRLAGVKAGDKVLINGAAGSLGTSAVQIAKLLGAEVTAVCSGKNAGLVKSLGADIVIDYRKEDFTESNARFDYIYDTIGKSSFGKAKRVLKATGTYLSPVLDFGLLGQMMLTKVWGKKKARFEATGSNKEALLAQLLGEVLELHKNGQLTTVMDRQYPLERVPEAYDYILTGHKKGNVVILAA